MTPFDGVQLPPTLERIPNPSYIPERLKNDLEQWQQKNTREWEDKKTAGNPHWRIFNETPNEHDWEGWKEECQSRIDALTQKSYDQRLMEFTNNLYKRFPGIDDAWGGATIDPENTEAQNRTLFKKMLREEVEQIIRREFDYNAILSLTQKANRSYTQQKGLWADFSPDEKQLFLRLIETTFIRLRQMGYMHDEIQQ